MRKDVFLHQAAHRCQSQKRRHRKYASSRKRTLEAAFAGENCRVTCAHLCGNPGPKPHLGPKGGSRLLIKTTKETLLHPASATPRNWAAPGLRQGVYLRRKHRVTSRRESHWHCADPHQHSAWTPCCRKPRHHCWTTPHRALGVQAHARQLCTRSVQHSTTCHRK